MINLVPNAVNTLTMIILNKILKLDVYLIERHLINSHLIKCQYPDRELIIYVNGNLIYSKMNRADVFMSIIH